MSTALLAAPHDPRTDRGAGEGTLLRALATAVVSLCAMPAWSAQADNAAAPSGAAVPAWVQNLSIKGDLRYRNETIDVQQQDRRNRDRLRVRASLLAQATSTVRVELGVATSEGNDPRSQNVTLGGASSRKDLYLDLAYAEWRALPALKVTAGKMRQPWQRAGSSALFDGDVNPEGLALGWQHAQVFGSAFHHVLDESATASETTLRGGQVGWKPRLAGGTLTVAAGYFDFRRVRQRAPFHAGHPNGNSTTEGGCAAGVAVCLSQDYNLIEGLVEFSRPVGGRPLTAFADYVRNDAADNGFDTAWSAGVTLGRASDASSWELGYAYQRVDKDALFGLFTDSDVGGGSTDHRAHVVRAGYAIARNWTVNAAWQFAETGLDAPALVGGVPLRGRDQQRVQLDLNFRF